MQTLSILIVVDVEAALASGNLGSHVWLIDNTGNVSGGEGTAELTTTCYNDQTIQWSVVPVEATSSVSIQQFTGTMISSQICVPTKVVAMPNVYWQGIVSPTAASGSYQYAVVLNMEGRTMTFDPFLNVQPFQG